MPSERTGSGKDDEFRMLMNNRPSSAPGPPASSTGSSSHWSCDHRSHTLTLSRLPDETVLQNVLSEAVSGGSEHGQLIVVSGNLFSADWLRIEAIYPTGHHHHHQQFLAVLDVDGRAVSGFTRRDFLAWLAHRLVLNYQTDAGGSSSGVQLTTAPLTGQFLSSPTREKNMCIRDTCIYGEKYFFQ